MKPADYKCRACNLVFEIWIEDDKDFQKMVACNHCGLPSRRAFTPAFPIIHQGKCGNNSNGYTSNPVKIKKT